MGKSEIYPYCLEDTTMPTRMSKTTDLDGNAEFPAPPRGYCIYVPG
jgi:hypothetical protein